MRPSRSLPPCMRDQRVRQARSLTWYWYTKLTHAASTQAWLVLGAATDTRPTMLHLRYRPALPPYAHLGGAGRPCAVGAALIVESPFSKSKMLHLLLSASTDPSDPPQYTDRIWVPLPQVTPQPPQGPV